MLTLMDAVSTNGVLALMLLMCATPFILIALVVLWLGPTRWPKAAASWWARQPAQARTALVRLQPLVWLLVGIFVGSALINPIAVWLRALLH